MPMKYTGVTSSAIAALAYEPTRRVMGVIFTNGDEYHYHEVPETTFEEVRSAPSIGSSFDSLVKKGGYAWEKIR